MTNHSRVPSSLYEITSDRIASSLARPPALRMTCASPSARPAYCAGSSRASMHVRMAKCRAGGKANVPFLPKFPVYARLAANTSSKTLLMIVSPLTWILSYSVGTTKTTAGIEPAIRILQPLRGFAGPRLTTWLRRHTRPPPGFSARQQRGDDEHDHRDAIGAFQSKGIHGSLPAITARSVVNRTNTIQLSAAHVNDKDSPQAQCKMLFKLVS